MLERILSRETLIAALTRVERNKGSHGVDGMPVRQLRANIRAGTYHPQPVWRVEIPKPNGGKRKLGVPTVVDRFIQQAIAQVLTEVYAPTFSKHSYGCRPNKQGHDAVREARIYIQQGYRLVVDLDLEKFFDKVNHDRLMRTLSKRIEDPKVLKLIRRFLQISASKHGRSAPRRPFKSASFQHRSR